MTLHRARHRATAVEDATSPASPQVPSSNGAMPGRLGVNVLVYYLTVVAAAVVGLVTTPILIHHLGTVRYGVWALVGSVVVYLELLELGVGAATTKLVAEDAKRRTDAVIRTLNTNVFVLGVFGLVAVVVGIALAPHATGWFNIPAGLRHQAFIALLVMTIAVSVSIPFDALGGALTAYERVDLLSVSNMVRALTAGIGGAVAAVLGGGIVAVTVVTAACGISVHYLRWRMLAGLVPGLRLSPRLIERPTLRITAGLSGWFMLRDATTVIITRLDLVVVGVMLDIRAVAVYSVALKLSQIGIRALQPFTALFFPRASALSADRDAAGLAALLVDGTRVSLVVATPLTLILALLARPALVAWVGGGFDEAVSVLVLLAVARGLAAVTETAWWMLGGAGYIKRTSTLSVVEAVVNLGSSIALAPVLGPAGVAAGSLIGVVSARLPVALTVSGRLAGLSTGTIARRAIVPHLVPSVLTAGAMVAVGRILPASPLPVLLAAGGGCLLYVAAYLLFGATPHERAQFGTAMSRMSRGRWRRVRHGRSQAPPQSQASGVEP